MKRLRSLLLTTMTIMVSATASAQNEITVTGTVVDNTGEPVIGASVIQKGTSNGPSPTSTVTFLLKHRKDLLSPFLI